MTRRKTTKRVNGHANGQAPPQTTSSRAPRDAAAVEAPRTVATRGTAPPSRGGLSMESNAASDDARGNSAAGAAHPVAACADRHAYAEAAPPLLPGNGLPAQAGVYQPYQTPEAAAESELAHLGELAEDGQGFVDAMHSLVNLYEVGKRFLKSPDDKIAQRAWERLLEMRYGKGPAPAVEETPRVDFSGLPRPDRD